jgi:phospholipid-binding lipoprotein MlaA
MKINFSISLIFFLSIVLFFGFCKISFASEGSKINLDFDDSEFEEYESLNNSAEIRDPLENFNRKIFSFNDNFDRYFFVHIAKIYRKDVPKVARKSIRNFLNNFSSPVSLFNSIIQGKKNNSLKTFSSFLINSTIGFGGLFDVASQKGISYKQEDFGQTLGYYGVSSGYYLVVPFLGPSSTRDFIGRISDQIISPTSINGFKIGGSYNLVGDEILVSINILSAIDTRESLIEIIEDVRKDSFDYYATVKSAYNQRRISEIKN